MRRVVIQYIFILVLLIGITMFDLAIAQSSSWNASFRLMYVAVIVIALQYDWLKALLYGAALGGIADLLQSTVFGSSILIHFCIISIVITLRHTWFKQQSIAVWSVFSSVAVFLSLLVHYSTRIVAMYIFKTEHSILPGTTPLSILGSILVILIGVTIAVRFIHTSKRVIII